MKKTNRDKLARLVEDAMALTGRSEDSTAEYVWHHLEKAYEALIDAGWVKLEGFEEE